MPTYLEPYLYHMIAALVVLAALILVVMVYGALAVQIRGRRGSRLGITEFREIDKSRRLVLVRRDGVEHLLLIGGMQDLVVESGIGAENGSAVRGAAARLEALPVPDDEHRPIPLRTAPRPAVFGERKPNLRPVPERDEPRLGESRSYEPDEKS